MSSIPVMSPDVLQMLTRPLVNPFQTIKVCPVLVICSFFFSPIFFIATGHFIWECTLIYNQNCVKD